MRSVTRAASRMVSPAASTRARATRCSSGSSGGTGRELGGGLAVVVGRAAGTTPGRAGLAPLLVEAGRAGHAQQPQARVAVGSQVERPVRLDVGVAHDPVHGLGADEGHRERPQGGVVGAEQGRERGVVARLGAPEGEQVSGLLAGGAAGDGLVAALGGRRGGGPGRDRRLEVGGVVDRVGLAGQLAPARARGRVRARIVGWEGVPVRHCRRVSSTGWPDATTWTGFVEIPAGDVAFRRFSSDDCR